MIFFYLSHRELIKNTAAVIQIDEQTLLDLVILGFKKLPTQKKYNLRFHTEQMIHFGSALAKDIG